MLTTRSRMRTAITQFWGGPPDFMRSLAPGVIATATPGHGGIVVSTEQFRLHPAIEMGLDGNRTEFINTLTGAVVLRIVGFEEDCSWAALLHFHPELIRPAIGKWLAADLTVDEVKAMARDTVARWHPSLLAAD